MGYPIVSQTEPVNSTLGPIYGKVEYGLSDLIGLQTNFSFVNYSSLFSYSFNNSTNNTFTTEYLKKLSSFSGVVRVNFHFTSNRKDVDVYAGGGVGVRNTNWITSAQTTPSNFSNNDYSTTTIKYSLLPELTVGGRYYFTKMIGIYGEVGFATSPVQLGLVLKF